MTTTDRTSQGAIVDWAFYRDGARDTSVASYRDAIQLAMAGQGFVWIGLHEPRAEEFADIAAEFGLHPLAAEDTVKAYQRPKLEQYDSSLFVVLKTVTYVPHDELTANSEIVTTGEVMVFLGEHFVVTVRHGDHGELSELRHDLESDPRRLAKGPSVVLHGVADRIVDDYLVVTSSVQNDIDEIELAVFSPDGSRDTARIYRLKREVLELRRAIQPLHLPLRALSEQALPFVHPRVREYFRDVEDHLHRVSDQVVSFDELLSSILQANLAQLSNSANDDMRRITAWAAITAVATVIAGIYGMNFEHMPELGWRFGYAYVLVLMGALCFFLYRRFKRSGWL